MKRLFAIAAVFGFGVQGFALDFCNDPFLQSGCGNFEAGFELLYLRPTTCDLQYAYDDLRNYVEVTGNPLTNTEQVAVNGGDRSVSGHHELGYGGLVGYIFAGGCVDVRLEYQGLHTDSGDDSIAPIQKDENGNITIQGGLWASRIYASNVSQDVVAGIPNPQFINLVLYNSTQNTALPGELDAVFKARTKWDYDMAEVQLGSRSRSGCNLWMRGWLAVHFAKLDERFSVHYEGTLHPGQTAPATLVSRAVVSDYKRKVATWAVGPRVGFEASYDLACCVGLGLKLGYGVLVGGADYRLQDTYQETDSSPLGGLLADRSLNVSAGRKNIVTPFVDIRTGINYTYCFSDCFVLLAEAGWGVRSYTALLRSAPFLRVDNSVSGFACQPFSLDGFYLNFTLQF